MKNNLKKLLALAMVVVLALCVVGCGGSGTSSTPVDNPSDVSSDNASDVSSNDTTSTGSSNTTSNTTSTPSRNQTTSDEEEDTVEYEKPNAGNDSVMYNKQSSKYDSQATSLRNTIIKAKDSGLKAKNVYYVSYKGNDFADGKSPETAWQSLSWASTVPSNSVVLFERGGVYRGQLKLKSNVSYGAYGKGAKPCIYGSAKNYADKSLWKKSTKKAGAWELKISDKDVGQIVFDHGKKVATKIPKGQAAKEYNFFLNGGTLYLYISDNPAKLYSDIEISGYYTAISGDKISNITIENLCVKYAGIHGMQFSNSENITVRNCEIGYIGGCGSNPPLGNGIEFWFNTKNVKVENCWIYQCFDAGITHQGQDAVKKDNPVLHEQQGIIFKNNLVEYCIYGIEYFAGNGCSIKDVLYTNNLIRFSGLGWSDPTTRTGEMWKDSSVSAINGWATNVNVGKFPAENFIIENNIFDTSWKFLINMMQPNTPDRVTVRNNTYYQKASDTAAAGIWLNEAKQHIHIESLEQMKEIIGKMDSSPKLIEFK